jgi:hypothetical protein
MPNFEEILNKPASSITAPQPIPTGTYHCLVEGPATPGKSSVKQTDFLQFKYKILSPRDDVDAAKAAEQQVIGKFITQDFYVTENETTQFMLKEFCTDTLGIEESDGNGQSKSLKELVAEAPGKQLLVNIVHNLSRDGKRIYHNVGSTARV